MTENLEDVLVEGWSTLDFAMAGHGIETQRIGIELDGGAVRVGLDGYGARHLLVPLTSGSSARDHRSGGVVLVGQELQVEGGTQLFADLVCVRPELNDVFGALAADVCAALEVEGNEPPRVIMRALERWRRLLGPSRPAEEFGRGAAIGLQGELILLERAIAAGGGEAVTAWTGPERLHHDFRRGRLALEVKTTTAREGLRVEIHGLEQLDSSAEVDLHLVVFKLIADPAGETLPDVVDRLIEAVPDAGDLLDRLAGAGYQHGETPAPEIDSDWRRYTVSDLLVWPVGPDFPAIRRSNLPTTAPAAIEGLRYTINLAGAGLPLGEAEVDALLTGLAGGT